MRFRRIHVNFFFFFYRAYNGRLILRNKKLERTKKINTMKYLDDAYMKCENTLSFRERAVLVHARLIHTIRRHPTVVFYI